MEELLKELRRAYIRAFVPTIILFAVVFTLTRFIDPLVGMPASFYVTTSLLLLTLVAFIVTYFILRTARMKSDGKSDEDRWSIFGKAYKTRIWAMSVISALGSISYAFTQDANAIYLVAIVTLLIILYFPAKPFIEKMLGE